MLVNYYYSLNVLADGPYTENDEPLHLCRGCAKKHADKVQWASRGHDQAECEFCDATNDPDYSRQMDEVYAEVTGKPAPKCGGV